MMHLCINTVLGLLQPYQIFEDNLSCSPAFLTSYTLQCHRTESQLLTSSICAALIYIFVTLQCFSYHPIDDDEHNTAIVFTERCLCSAFVASNPTPRQDAQYAKKQNMSPLNRLSPAPYLTAPRDARARGPSSRARMSSCYGDD